MQHSFTIADTEHAVWLSRAGDSYCLHVDDRPVPVSLHGTVGGACVLHIEGCRHDAVVAVDGDVVHIHVDGETFAVRYTDPTHKYAHSSTGASDDVALAPMPGVVVAANVRPGDQVEVGQTLLIIESMKLETSIKAWREGRVATLHVAKGDTFERSAALVTLAPAGER